MAFLVKVFGNFCCSLRHNCHGLTFIAFFSQRIQTCSPGFCHRIGINVRLKGRLSDDSYIYDNSLKALFLDPFFDEGEIFALCV